MLEERHYDFLVNTVNHHAFITFHLWSFALPCLVTFKVLCSAPEKFLARCSIVHRFEKLCVVTFLHRLVNRFYCLRLQV